MNTYIALYRNKQVEVVADTIAEAQELAAKQVGAKYVYDVSVFLLVNPNVKLTINPQF